MTTDLFCPTCSRRITEFTFFICEPAHALTIDGTEDYEEEENLELDLAVRCDGCFEFLPRRFYAPLSTRYDEVAAQEEAGEEEDEDAVACPA